LHLVVSPREASSVTYVEPFGTQPWSTTAAVETGRESPLATVQLSADAICAAMLLVDGSGAPAAGVEVLRHGRQQHRREESSLVKLWHQAMKAAASLQALRRSSTEDGSTAGPTDSWRINLRG